MYWKRKSIKKKAEPFESGILLKGQLNIKSMFLGRYEKSNFKRLNSEKNTKQSEEKCTITYFLNQRKSHTKFLTIWTTFAAMEIYENNHTFIDMFRVSMEYI